LLSNFFSQIFKTKTNPKPLSREKNRRADQNAIGIVSNADRDRNIHLRQQ
jgi:hypothetical protein